jgi:hypothetical protein
MPNKEQVHNPIFARFYARTAEMAEAKGASEHRDELGNAINRIVHDADGFTTANTLRLFLAPLVLTLVLLPFARPSGDVQSRRETRARRRQRDRTASTSNIPAA